MSVVFRTLLALLLAVAIPMQGMAAAAMLHCGPSHHRSAVVQSSAHDDSAHEHSGHQVEGASVEAAGNHGAGDAPNGLGDASQAKCSACANCCSYAAMPNAVSSLAEPRLEAVGFIASPQSFVPVDLSGLKRPPRSILA